MNDTLLQHPLARVAAASPEVFPATLGRRLTALLGDGAMMLASLLVVPLFAVTGSAVGLPWIVGCLGVLGFARLPFGCADSSAWSAASPC